MGWFVFVLLFDDVWMTVSANRWFYHLHTIRFPETFPMNTTLHKHKANMRKSVEASDMNSKRMVTQQIKVITGVVNTDTNKIVNETSHMIDEMTGIINPSQHWTIHLSTYTFCMRLNSVQSIVSSNCL